MTILGSDHYWGDWCGYDSIAKAYYYIPINFAQTHSKGARFMWLKACDGLARTRFTEYSSWEGFRQND